MIDGPGRGDYLILGAFEDDPEDFEGETVEIVAFDEELALFTVYSGVFDTYYLVKLDDDGNYVKFKHLPHDFEADPDADDDDEDEKEPWQA